MSLPDIAQLVSQHWVQLIQWVSDHLVVGTLSFLHMQDAGDPRKIAEAALYAVLQISIIACVFRPLETWAPAEKWENRDHTKIDRLYTLIMLLGLFPLFSYLVLSPFAHLLGGTPEGAAVEAAFSLKHQIPWLAQHPALLLLVYYLIYDMTYYWMHRAEHLIPWWWAMHSMHHSQRQMSCWTNDRGCYLDGVLQSFILASVGLAVGIDLSEFALLTLISELVQNFSHTNTRIGFGRFFERVFVDPKFHRLHHMKVDETRPWLHNCNFGQVFSIWDNLFGTALYGEPPRPTGVSDPAVDADNERGLIMMQWYTLKRFWGAFKRPAGWRPGDVGFEGDSFEPVPSSYRNLEPGTAMAAERAGVSG
jgi:sterol desaturase/sphingolipid hydroxylase (fatty acid hydroxylase superfamily)